MDPLCFYIYSEVLIMNAEKGENGMSGNNDRNNEENAESVKTPSAVISEAKVIEVEKCV